MKQLLLALLLIPSAFASQAQDRLHYYFVDFPPFHFQNAGDPSPRGLTLDLLRLAALDAGERLSIQKVPLNRFIQLTQAGKVEVALVSQEYRQAFASQYLCSATDLTRIHPTVFVNGDRYPDLTSVQALTNHTVHAPRSVRFVMSRLLPEGTDLDTSYAIHLVTRGFNAGRIGLLADFRERMTLNLAQETPAFPVRTLALKPIGIALCVNNTLPDAYARQRALEKAFLKVANSAQGQTLLQQYQMALTFAPTPTH
ncbi:hypothetical protein [Simiduia agarivorans]|uniref:Solute-binding protein family 3/N-terminal domain-containing protein n=1 Tax=Simiduia agarivorans (strain DSM 21679 / JCM 13881 / BCRC 17597 / SA1) TaxID=1117647 RepID=K4KLH1_SIMAS|nr:hypothetical protein [Simiduia agarivorans]AFV00015.1 hypothetical protein M5M_14390 [Simiduia agarivorans SA1 = DSM 21679]